MESIACRLADLLRRIDEATLRSGRAPGSVSLLAVTKTVEAARIRASVEAGITLVGENRVQEMQEKGAQGAYEGAELHFIGHLQRNKVADVVGHVALIQSVDSFRLAEAIERRAESCGVVQDVLLEVNVGEEETKSGFTPDELYVAAERYASSRYMRLRGLMCIPPPAVLGDNSAFFMRAHQLYVDISSKMGDNASMDILSMGMSDDFEAAIMAGSTMVRLGSVLFGHR